MGRESGERLLAIGLQLLASEEERSVKTATDPKSSGCISVDRIKEDMVSASDA